MNHQKQPRSAASTTALRAFMLARLARFASLAASPDVDRIPSARELASHATLAAYRDCVALGLRPAATVLIDRVMRAVTSSA